MQIGSPLFRKEGCSPGAGQSWGTTAPGSGPPLPISYPQALTRPRLPRREVDQPSLEASLISLLPTKPKDKREGARLRNQRPGFLSQLWSSCSTTNRHLSPPLGPFLQPVIIFFIDFLVNCLPLPLKGRLHARQGCLPGSSLPTASMWNTGCHPAGPQHMNTQLRTVWLQIQVVTFKNHT